MADPTRPRKNEEDPGVRQFSWRFWVLIVAVAIFVITAIQNSQRVDVKFLFIDAETPLIVALLLAGILGAIIGYVAPVMRSHSRSKQRHNER